MVIMHAGEVFMLARSHADKAVQMQMLFTGTGSFSFSSLHVPTQWPKLHFNIEIT